MLPAAPVSPVPPLPSMPSGPSMPPGPPPPPAGIDAPAPPPDVLLNLIQELAARMRALEARQAATAMEPAQSVAPPPVSVPAQDQAPSDAHRLAELEQARPARTSSCGTCW